MEVVVIVDVKKLLVGLDKSIERAGEKIPEDGKDYWCGYHDALVDVKELFTKAMEE